MFTLNVIHLYQILICLFEFAELLANCHGIGHFQILLSISPFARYGCVQSEEGIALELITKPEKILYGAPKRNN